MIRHGLFLAVAALLAALCLTPVSALNAAAQTAVLKAISGDKTTEKDADNTDNLPKSMESLVEQARKDGFAVVVISPQDEAPASSDADMSTMMTEMGLTARQRLKVVLANAPNLPSDIAAAVRSASPDGTMNWLLIALATAIGGILVGFLPSRAIQYWGREHFRHMYHSQPSDRAEKIGYLLFRAALMLINAILLFAVAAVIAIIFDTDHAPTRATIFVIVSTYAIWRVTRYVILFNLFAPDVPSHRMLNISDADASAVYREWSWAIAVATLVAGITTWFGVIHLAPDSHILAQLVGSLIAAMLIAFMTIRYRRVIAGVILGAGDPEEKPGWRRFLASTWHIIGLLYLVAAWLMTAFNIVLDLPNKPLLIIAPPAAFIGALAAYGVILLLIERFYRARRASFERKLRVARNAELEQRRTEEAARKEAEKEGIEEGEEQVENIVTPQPLHELPTYRPLFKPLLEQTAAIVVTLGAIGLVLAAWDVRAGERGNPITAFMDTLSFIVLAWVLYRAVDIYVAAKLADEAQGEGDPHAIDDEPAGHGTSRIGTLLPIIRLAAKTTIVVIVGMIVLSNLGVDIAPLFAGAGVVGLAVGFGAQTLIRDIFSGGFFLFDDAFRKGEYIELGDIRGTVEKISLRSFQLRHHNGPLHTIPFGEIKQLTNYSRDWVIMKLPLRLTFDTDIEKVRKLVKKLGQQLLEHPEVGKNFLQPLKSQGVVQMDDSAMILRVKFMTKPGDQWVTRKVVYASIQELFHREGIHFANREVTVRIADTPGARSLSEEEREKAAAAAARTLQDETGSPPSGDDR